MHKSSSSGNVGEISCEHDFWKLAQQCDLYITLVFDWLQSVRNPNLLTVVVKKGSSVVARVSFICLHFVFILTKCPSVMKTIQQTEILQDKLLVDIINFLLFKL